MRFAIALFLASSSPWVLDSTQVERSMCELVCESLLSEGLPPVSENPPCSPVLHHGPPEAGSFDWIARHRAVMETARSRRDSKLILVGDSITHGWGGVPEPGPQWKGTAPRLYDDCFGKWKPINMGFGWDQTGHVLWRLQNGALDGLSPRVAVVLIGTNNTMHHTSEQIAGGIVAVVDDLQRRLPQTHVLLLSILPRDKTVTENRRKNDRANQLVSALDGRDGVTYLDMTAAFTHADGRLRTELFPDDLHLNEEGYEVWAKTMMPTLNRLMSEE